MGPLGSAMKPQDPAAQEALSQEAGGGDQQVFDTIVANAQSFIHDEANSDRIVEAMKSGDPAQVAGQQAAIILTGIVESAGRSGVEPSAEVAMATALVIIEEVVDLAVAAGVIEEAPVEDQEFQQAAMQSFQQTVESEQGTPEEAQAPEEVAQGQEPAGVLARSREVV